jgi:spermidine/putrescine transport system permease protein
MFGLSFNASESRAEWAGFTLDWYMKLFQDENIISALKVTLTVAVIATIVSVIIGTLGAIGMYSMKKGWFNLLSAISNIPMTMPDIVTGVSLMLMFVFTRIPLGRTTMIMAHIAFDTPYVLLSVLPRLQLMNPNIYEAALDLGCKPFKALWKVILPEISPGIVTGGLLALAFMGFSGLDKGLERVLQ